MFNIKKKEYNNWLFLLKNYNSSNVHFFTFLQAKYIKTYNWKELSLLCLKLNLHKIAKFYLLNLNKNFYLNLKGNSIYYGLCNIHNLDNILKNFNFLFILTYSKCNDLFLFYLNKNKLLDLYILNKSLILTLNLIFLYNYRILQRILVTFLKIFIFKIKNDIIN